MTEVVGDDFGARASWFCRPRPIGWRAPISFPHRLVALLFRRAICGMPEIELAQRSDLLPSYCSGRKFDENYEQPFGLKSCHGCRVMRPPPRGA